MASSRDRVSSNPRGYRCIMLVQVRSARFYNRSRPTGTISSFRFLLRLALFGFLRCRRFDGFLSSAPKAGSDRSLLGRTRRLHRDLQRSLAHASVH